MASCSRKNKYIDVDGAQRGAAKYTKMYGFKVRWYLCPDCSYYHITTVRHQGVKVLDLDAIRTEGRDE
jgi:hypothetical protein